MKRLEVIQKYRWKPILRQVLVPYAATIISVFVSTAEHSLAAPRLEGRGVVKLFDKRYRLLSLEGARSYTYQSGYVDGSAVEGSQFVTFDSGTVSTIFSGFKVRVNGAVNSEHKISTELGGITNSCSTNFSSEPFTFSLSVFTSGARSRLFGSYDTDPMNPTYQEALLALCPEEPVGITSFTVSALATGSDDARCDSHELCTRVNSRLKNARNLRVKFKKTETLQDGDVSAVRSTNVTLRLRRM